MEDFFSRRPLKERRMAWKLTGKFKVAKEGEARKGAADVGLLSVALALVTSDLVTSKKADNVLELASDETEITTPPSDGLGKAVVSSADPEGLVHKVPAPSMVPNADSVDLEEGEWMISKKTARSSSSPGVG